MDYNQLLVGPVGMGAIGLGAVLLAEGFGKCAEMILARLAKSEKNKPHPPTDASKPSAQPPVSLQDPH